jgi:hypothetical protein
LRSCETATRACRPARLLPRAEFPPGRGRRPQYHRGDCSACDVGCPGLKSWPRIQARTPTPTQRAEVGPVLGVRRFCIVPCVFQQLKRTLAAVVLGGSVMQMKSLRNAPIPPALPSSQAHERGQHAVSPWGNASISPRVRRCPLARGPATMRPRCSRRRGRLSPSRSDFLLPPAS